MLCSIDIGTNTVRLLVAEPLSSGDYTPLLLRQRVTRLGENAAHGLQAVAMQRTAEAVCELVTEARTYPLNSIRTVATAAVRSACNADTFVQLIRDSAKLDIEIISTEEEARLTARGVLSVLNRADQRMLIFDLGGGSMELCLCDSGSVVFSTSIPVGVVQLAESCSDDVAQNALRDALSHLRGCPDFEQILSPECRLVGTAGTATTLAALQLGMKDYDPGRINNLSLTLDDLKHLKDTLSPLDVVSREALPGLEKGRGDLIVPGLRFILRLMTSLRKDHLIVSDAGLLEGVLLEMLQAR